MARQENTKELFLSVALKLFSEKGFERVTLAEIAREVGCVPSALYRHYANKQKLYEAILETSVESFEASLEHMHIDFAKRPEERERYLSMTEEEEIGHIQGWFSLAVHNDWASAFRKLMMIEQFRLKELGEMYDRRYIHAQYEQYAALFSMLMDAGKLRRADPYDLAVLYMSPVITLIGVCDREPEKEAWALERIERNIKEFNRAYRLS